MAADSEKRSDYLNPYREAVKEHGAGFAATLWGTRNAQQLRFDVMIDLATLDDCVIIDAGCGDGDFAARLLERTVQYGSFIGIDAMEAMVERARTRDFPRAQFLAADMVADPGIFARHAPDYVCFSGTLNTMDDATAQRLIKAAFEASAQGVIFNFLSDRPHPRWLGRDLTPARRFPTLAWVDWALGLTSRVAMTQAYLDGHDVTILMQHDGQADDDGSSSND